MASVYEGDSHDLRIVLLGVSGAGKSPTANAILGQEAFRESRTRESEIQRGRVEDRNISIIDTPGFFNTQLTDEEQRKQMMKSLDLSHPGPHVFLLIINLETFRDDQRNIVEQILQNFGEEALLFTMVLFVGREKISKREWIEIKENEETQKILKYFEGRFIIMNSKNECSPNQITKLLRKIEEMVGNNEGLHYSNESYRKTKFGNQVVRAEQEVMQEMQEERDAEEQETNIHSKLDIKPERVGDSPSEDDEGKQETATGLRIILLGKTGSGRSSSGNAILGRDAFRVSFLSSTHSCEKQEAVVSGRTISIIDTPGLFDAPWYKHLKGEVKCDIEECLNMAAPGPHVFLLVVKLNGRHTEDEKNTAKWIQENFGEDALRHTIVLFTHADFLIGESLDQYMRKSPDLQSLIDSCGGRFHSFNNQDRDNQSQVTKLLEKIGKLVKDNREAYHSKEKSRKMKQGEMRNDTSQEAAETQQASLHRAHLLTLMMELEMSEMALRLSLARAVAQSRLPRQDLRIVLLGFLGSGKSSTANTILGREAFNASVVSTTLTCERQAAEKSGRTISITDTPPITVSGSLFSGSQQSEVEKSLEMCAPGPHVFLLVIGLVGLANVENDPAKWFQENLEKDALNHTIVLFTHAGLLNRLINGPLNEYIKKNLSLKSLIDSCGGRYHLLDNEEIQNRLQVTVLLMKIDEMVQNNGGKHYTRQNIFKRAPKSKPLATKKQDTSDCEIL